MLKVDPMKKNAHPKANHMFRIWKVMAVNGTQYMDILHSVWYYPDSHAFMLIVVAVPENGIRLLTKCF